MAAVPGGGNAVEHINAPSDSLDQIFRKSNPHKITRAVPGQAGAQFLQYPMHDRLWLADRQPADGGTGPGPLRQGALERPEPKIGVGPSLNDRPKRLGLRACR